MAELNAFCAIFAALVVFGLNTSASVQAEDVASRRFNVTRTEVAQSWQSSSYSSRSRCFPNAGALGNWDYFHTSGIPDPFGNQWLLMKLTRPMRVLSVTVYGRSETANRTEGIEIFLSHEMPAGLSQSSDSCIATLSSITDSSGTQCGVTRTERSSVHRVACGYSDCTKLTQFILLRKNVTNAAEQYVNFVALELEEASQESQIFACKAKGTLIRDCKLNGLKEVRIGDKYPMKLCPSCQLTALSDATCRIAHRNGSDALQIVGTPSTQLMVFLQISSDIHGDILNCSFQCSDGEYVTATESISFIAESGRPEIEPRNAHMIGSTAFLSVGTEFLFSFITKDAYSKPTHTCRLVRDASQKEEQTAGLILPPTIERNDSTSSHKISYVSEFSVSINAVAVGKWILCVSRLQGASTDIARAIQVPTIVYPISPNFLAPSSSLFKNGAKVNVTVDSEGSLVPTSHTCYLESEGRNHSLEPIHTTNTSSSFVLNVSKSWGDSASLVCLVNQSGLIENQTRYRLPRVLYEAQGLSLQLHSVDLLSDTRSNFSLVATDPGYPPASLAECSIGERSLENTLNSSFGRFTPERDDNGKQIKCKVVQTLNGITIYDSLTAFGLALNVKYEATVTWPSSQSQEVKEGQSLSVEVLADGNPEPSFQCSLREISGQFVTMIEMRHPNQSRSFQIEALRSMNLGNLTCLVTQSGFLKKKQSFTQSVTVFYKPQPPIYFELPAVLYEGVSINFTVRSGNANPGFNHSCSVDNGLIGTWSSRNVSSMFLTEMRYSPKRMDSKVTCTANQRHRSQIVFNNTLDKSISVNYVANNHLDIVPSSPAFEGSSVTVNLTSYQGRPAVMDHKCRLGESLLTMENEMRGPNSRTFTFRAERKHNSQLLLCEFIQDEHLSQWKTKSLSVFFRSHVDLNGSQMSGNSVLVSVNVTDGNPSPRVNCSLLTDAGIRYPVAANNSVNSEEFRFGTHSVQVELQKHSRSVNISCSVKQDYAEFSESEYTFQVTSFVDSPSSASGRVFFVPFGCLLALGLVIGGIFISVRFGWFQRLRVQYLGGGDGGGGSSSDARGRNSDVGGAGRIEMLNRKILERNGSPDTEAEFMRTHYLYKNLPRVEYATVVKVRLTETDLADSTETIHLTIVGYRDDDEVISTQSDEKD